MKIVILYFDVDTGYFPSLHHGLASIAGYLCQQQIEFSFVHIKDDSSWNLALQKLQMGPELVGLSFVTNQLRHVKRFLQQLPPKNCVLVAGGVHATITGENIFQEIPQLDGVCVGEGEYAFSALALNILQDKDFAQTPGFYFYDQGKVKKNEMLHLEAIDDLPLPDYSIFDVRDIVKKSGMVFPMMLGRGCPFDCSYCCNHILKKLYPDPERYVRIPLVEKAIAIIKQNLKSCPDAQKIVFADDTFTLDKEWAREFCIQYKKEINLPFLCNARVETIDNEILTSLKNAGCVSVDFGVESGNEWLRYHVLNRRHSNAKIIEAFKMAQEHGLSTFSFNMMGLPFETESMMQDTLKLNMKLRPSFGKCFYFFPYPGSRLYSLCKEYNMIDEKVATEVSGYLEKPIVKEVFATHAQMYTMSQKAQLYFYVRLIASRLKLPAFCEGLLFSLVNIFRKPLLAILSPGPDDHWARKIRNLLRAFSLKYLR